MASNGEQHIIYPRDDDILCGKSKACVKHVGSRRYREFLETYTGRYAEATTKHQKTTITKEIYETLKSRRCRFLRFNKGRGEWEEIGPATARDKISHALRWFADNASSTSAAARARSASSTQVNPGTNTYPAAAVPVPATSQPNHKLASEGLQYEEEEEVPPRVVKQKQQQQQQGQQDPVPSDMLAEAQQPSGAPRYRHMSWPSAQLGTASIINTALEMQQAFHPASSGLAEMGLQREVARIAAASRPVLQRHNSSPDMDVSSKKQDERLETAASAVSTSQLHTGTTMSPPFGQAPVSLHDAAVSRSLEQLCAMQAALGSQVETGQLPQLGTGFLQLSPELLPGVGSAANGLATNTAAYVPDTRNWNTKLRSAPISESGSSTATSQINERTTSPWLSQLQHYPPPESWSNTDGNELTTRQPTSMGQSTTSYPTISEPDPIAPGGVDRISIMQEPLIEVQHYDCNDRTSSSGGSSNSSPSHGRANAFQRENSTSDN